MELESTEAEDAAAAAVVLPSLRGYKVLRKIGFGAFGEVFEAERDTDGKKVAVKRTIAKSEQERAFMKQELEVLCSVQECAFVVRLLDSWTAGVDETFLVMEFMTPLSVFAQQRMTHFRQVSRVLRDVLSGLSFLHSHNIAHLDVKSDNVLLRDDSTAVLIDFGFAQRVSSTDPAVKVLTCTVDYQSPEIAKAEPADPRSADVWALGVLAFLLLTGELPFVHANRVILRTMLIRFHSLDMSRFESLVPPLAVSFVSSLISPLATRLSAQQALDHPFLASDVDKLLPHHVAANAAAVMERQALARAKLRAGVFSVMASLAIARRSVVVVTGGGRGVGAALVRALVAAQHRVVFSTRAGPREGLPSSAFHIATGDFCDEANVHKFADQVLEKFGPVKILINNAGEMVGQDQSVALCSGADVHRSMAVNCVAPMILMQKFLPSMKEGGNVLNISSSLGAMYGMGALNFAYRASKASLNALTLVMAAEYPHVRINSACVGIVDTDMTKHLSNVAKVSPEEAVEQLLWLLEDDAPTAGFWRNGEQIYW